jgi:hypothetical protein
MNLLSFLAALSPALLHRFGQAFSTGGSEPAALTARASSGCDGSGLGSGGAASTNAAFQSFDSTTESISFQL